MEMGHVGLAILAAEQRSIMAGTNMGRCDLAGVPYWGILAQKTEHSLLSFHRIQQLIRHRLQGADLSPDYVPLVKLEV